MEQITTPFGQVIEIRQIFHDSGVRLLRVIVHDGTKYFTLELDPATAHQWGRHMVQWAEDYDKR
ncbi:MAG: hypothetical protein M0Z44_07635 [Gammaproteobacteria bacterium]|nr:hypothetical protein [Gammaproteobacteria bacterium]